MGAGVGQGAGAGGVLNAYPQHPALSPMANPHQSALTPQWSPKASPAPSGAAKIQNEHLFWMICLRYGQNGARHMGKRGWRGMN